MLPILYSFRRCPYAIRARLAIASSGVRVALREIVLRDKAAAFLAASPSATVPCLVSDHTVLDESFDIMIWALRQSDPAGLCALPQDGYTLIKTFDGPFKTALDQTKYAVRHPERDPERARAKAMDMLANLDAQLESGYLYNARQSLADVAILPFVRQFANIDKARFDAEAPVNVSRWLDRFLDSSELAAVMQKYKPWGQSDDVVIFPQPS